MANTAIQITCYDRNGNEVKRVTSTSGEVEDPEQENNGGENTNTENNGGTNPSGGGGTNPGGGDNGGDDGTGEND